MESSNRFSAFASSAWMFLWFQTGHLAAQQMTPLQTSAASAENRQAAQVQTSTGSFEGERTIPLHTLTAPTGRTEPTAPVLASTGPGRVIATFMDRNIMKMVLETRDPLIPGRIVYVGPDSLRVTVGDLMSHPESLYYYSASIRGKQKIANGDPFSLAPPRASESASFLSSVIKEHYNFEQKYIGTVTAVQGDRALIDRGTLHEVRERDIYRVYDSSGHYKGMLEVRGLGDLQSSGKLYNRLEDWRHRDVMKAEPGDRVVFVGQRKMFALGFIGGQTFKGAHVLDGKEKIFGGGMVWDITFPDGWGAEVLLGGYIRDGDGRNDSSVLVPVVGGGFSLPAPSFESDQHRATFIAPVWLKKNFFYPYVVSPFIAIGPALFYGLNRYNRSGVVDPSGVSKTVADEEKRKVVLIPALGAGIEFFPGRFFRPRFEVRYFPGPNLVAGGNTFYTESVFYSLGFLTTW